MSAKVLSQIGKAVRFIASSAPRYGFFFINTGCNRRCVYCVVPEQGSGVELPVETWYKITDRAVDWGVRLISILGGEPTLRKDYLQIVEYATKKAAVNLTSNGDTFVGSNGQERLKALASTGITGLTLSLHDLKEVDRQLDMLVSARGMGVLTANLATVVTRGNIEQMPDIMRAANDRGILYRYSLVNSVGGSFSSDIGGLAPTPEQISTFVAIVREQQKRTHLVQVTQNYMSEGTTAYPRGWHCDSYKDNWVVVDNEGKLMACSEHPTGIHVLDLPTLGDPTWNAVRTEKREACEGCSYQCYIDMDNLKRLDLVREAVGTARGLFQSRKRS